MAKPVNYGEILIEVSGGSESNQEMPFNAASTAGVQDPKVARYTNTDNLLNVFSQAFPDQDFEITADEQGRRGIKSKPKLARSSESGTVVPTGYSAPLAEKGLQDLQTALEAAKTDEERFEIASKLNIATQVYKAHKFGEYKRRADAEHSLPELELALTKIRQAEAASPFNPRNGMPSAQQMTILETIGLARARSANRIKEMMDHDTTIASAEALAKGTIASIQGKLVMEGRTEELERKRAQKEARNAAISAMPPEFLQAVSVIRNGTVSTDLTEIAAQIYDKKMLLNEGERFLASASPDTLKDFYNVSKNPKERGLALKLLETYENDVVGDKKQTAKHIELFKKISEKGFQDTNDLSIPAHIRERYRRMQSEITAQAAASGKSRDEMLQEGTLALKRELLADTVKTAMFSDLSNWNGLIKGDTTAQSVFKQAGDKKLDLKRFVSDYLMYQDGKTIEQKGKSLQAIMASGMESLPRSVVLPIPSAESMMLEAQAMTAQMISRIMFSDMMRQAGGTSLGGVGSYR